MEFTFSQEKKDEKETYCKRDSWPAGKNEFSRGNIKEAGAQGVQGVGMLNQEGRESLTKKTFHQIPGGSEEASHVDAQGEHSSRENSKGKGPEARLRTCKEASLGAVEGEERAGGDWQDPGPDCARPCGPSLDSSWD